MNPQAIPITDLIARLTDWITPFGSAIVAYSGGVDSALVMAAAHQALGHRALACIGVSPSYPERELNQAIELAESIGAAYRKIETQEHLDERYIANGPDRCYFCKSHLHEALKKIAYTEGYAVVLDGNNADDVHDDRPGRKAAGERGVRSPLLELGFTKADVRAMAKAMNIPVWDKPAMACLSSRVPTGTAVTPTLLNQIEHAEDVLVSLGFRQFRVRHHGELARLELPVEDFAKAIDHRLTIVAKLNELGYRRVTLDLAPADRFSSKLPKVNP